MVTFFAKEHGSDSQNDLKSTEAIYKMAGKDDSLSSTFFNPREEHRFRSVDIVWQEVVVILMMSVQPKQLQ